MKWVKALQLCRVTRGWTSQRPSCILGRAWIGLVHVLLHAGTFPPCRKWFVCLSHAFQSSCSPVVTEHEELPGLLPDWNSVDFRHPFPFFFLPQLQLLKWLTDLRMKPRMTFCLLAISGKELQPLSWKLIRGTVERPHLGKLCGKSSGEMLCLKKHLVRNLFFFFPFLLANHDVNTWLSNLLQGKEQLQLNWTSNSPNWAVADELF